jgi:hypothetical protein
MLLVSSTLQAWDKFDRIRDPIAAVTIPSEWVAVITFTIGTNKKSKNKQ